MMSILLQRIVLKRLWLLFYYATAILFSLLYISIVNSTQGQTQTFPLPTISKLPSVKITSPHNGDNITIHEPLYVTGISNDDALTNCMVSIITNNIKPYRDVNATGNSGNGDYSTWNFTQNPTSSQLKVGPNKITSKMDCPGNASNSTKWYSINVTGISTANSKNNASAYSNNNNNTSTNTSQLVSNGKNILPQGQPMTGNNMSISEKQITSSSSSLDHRSLLGISNPPIADAGADQIVSANSVVTLNGAQSKDTDGRVTSYSWIQLAGGGTEVALRNADYSIATLKIPDFKKNILLKFKLIVVDNDNLSSSDTTNVLVRPRSQSVISKDVPCEKIGITNSC